MLKMTTLLVVLTMLGAFVAIAAKDAEACCGIEIDPWRIDIVGGECDDPATFDGLVYTYYWPGSGLPTTLSVTVAIVPSGGGPTLKILTTTGSEIRRMQSYGADDDGIGRGSPQGLVDEDPNWPPAGNDDVDNDGDGWVDEDPGYPNDAFADWEWSIVWDGTDTGGNPVPDGDYEAVITVQSGVMNWTETRELVQRGCCADLQAVEYTLESYSFSADMTTFTSTHTVTFVNVGTDDAYDVTATIVEVPPSTTATDPNVSLGDIPAGGEASSSDTFELTIDMTNLSPDPFAAMMYWDVSYTDEAGRRCIIRRVPKFPGEP
jgi:hypothetical protein